MKPPFQNLPLSSTFSQSPSLVPNSGVRAHPNPLANHFPEIHITNSIQPQQGGEKSQSAFYVFEELATTPQTTSPSSLTMQAVAELHLHRFPEAEAALNSALSLDPNFAEAIVNLIVLNTILGRQEQVEEGMKKLEQVAPKHKFLEDWKLKREEFGKAAGRYQPKFDI